jgi:ABC-type antimicrobial peptide transport system permease subunit
VGLPVNVRIVATTALFAPFDPATPFAIADLATLDSIGYAAVGRTEQAAEWWLRVAPGAEPAVLAALRDRSAGTASVVGREELTRELTTDPVPLGLIGVLGLGSIAAMLFAGIGFLVSSTISTSERIGEFALLRALGLSTAQLSLWLSIESVFLLVVGLVAGSALGLILAWLVLPFATLTQTGLAPVPAPVVDVPWQALLPPYVAAILLFGLSLWLVRRQLPDIRISGVLRARES